MGSCFQLLPVARLAPWDTVIDLACYNAAPVIVPIPTRFDPQLASECASIRFHRSAIQRPVCVLFWQPDADRSFPAVAATLVHLYRRTRTPSTTISIPISDLSETDSQTQSLCCWMDLFGE